MRYAVYEPTPIESVDYIKDIIKDKVVYDIGSGSGHFAMAMSLYAKKVVGIEEDEMYAGDCEIRGLETIKSDFMMVNLEEAEVLFFFMGFIGAYALSKKIVEDNWHGTVISHYYPLQHSPTDLWEPSEIIDVKTKNMRFPFLIYKI